MKVKGVFHRPTTFFGVKFEYERMCWDPKDGELCLNRMNSEETLMEVRIDTDVQIVRHTWV